MGAIVTFVAIALSASAGAGEGDDTRSSREADPIDNLVDALVASDVCIPRDHGTLGKNPKTYPQIWPPARRRGINQVLTTFYNVHSKEAVPVYVNRSVPNELFDHLFRCRGFAVAVRLHSISAFWRRVVLMVTGSSISNHGIPARGSCWFRKPVGE